MDFYEEANLKFPWIYPPAYYIEGGKINGTCTTIIRKVQMIPVSLLKKRLQLPRCRRPVWAVTLPGWSYTPSLWSPNHALPFFPCWH